MEHHPTKRVRLSHELPSEDLAQPYLRKRYTQTPSRTSSLQESHLTIPVHSSQYHLMCNVEGEFHAKIFQRDGQTWIQLTKVKPESRLNNELVTQMDWVPTSQPKQRDDCKVLEAIEKILNVADAIAQRQG